MDRRNFLARALLLIAAALLGAFGRRKPYEPPKLTPAAWDPSLFRQELQGEFREENWAAEPYPKVKTADEIVRDINEARTRIARGDWAPQPYVSLGPYEYSITDLQRARFT